MIGWRAAVGAVVAVVLLAPAVGCGFVEDDPAGSAAAIRRGAGNSAVTTIPGRSVLGVPAGGSGSGAPAGAPAGGSGSGASAGGSRSGASAGGSRSGASAGGSGSGAPAGAPAGGSGSGASAGGTGSGAQGGASGRLPAPGFGGAPAPRPPTLTEEDRRALARCDAIDRFQKAGIDVVIVSIKEPSGLVPAMRRLQTAVDGMLTELEPSARAEVEPMAGVIRNAVVPGMESRPPQQLIAELNVTLDAAVPLFSRALRALTVTCPAAVPPDSIDQPGELRLGMQLPPGVDPALAFS